MWAGLGILMGTHSESLNQGPEKSGHDLGQAVHNSA